MPSPVLDGCTEPLDAEVPDLRGTWRVVSATMGGNPVPEGHRILDHVERIEQAGRRVVVIADGVIHDMVCDGTEANGVHDVAAADFTTPITVVASFEDGVHVLRPAGMPVEVTRRLDGDELVWSYAGLFVARLRRL